MKAYTCKLHEDGQWVTSETCSGGDVCANGSRQLGETPCGDAGTGFFFQDCVDGAWVDNDQCSSEPDCEADETRNSEIPCGFNLEGFLIDYCTNSYWVTLVYHTRPGASVFKRRLRHERCLFRA